MTTASKPRQEIFIPCRRPCCAADCPRSGLKRHCGPHRFVLEVRDLATDTVRSVRANFIISCHGVHGRQLAPGDHGVPVSKRFRGTVALGGRSGGVDSAVGTTCVNGKVLPMNIYL